MHSYTILFALVSATANLAVAAPRDVAEESPIVCLPERNTKQSRN